MNHEEFIARTIELAKLGSGYVAPNPLVGSVITDSSGNIIAEGYHHKHGDIHAEIDALNKCQNIDLSEAILYCNLEPCSHSSPEKINPPCAPQIIKAGIKKVVIGMTDPNPKVAGNGVKILQDAGIEVITGVLEQECQDLNKIFTTNILKKKTHILVKIAQTLDGQIATASGSSKWITDIDARKYVHSLRNKFDAVMVGSQTVFADNPKLDVRLVEGRNPKRIVIDSNLSIPLNYNLVTDQLIKDSYIFTSELADPEKLKELKSRGVNIIELKSDNQYVPLKQVFEELYKLKIYSVMIEGGAGLVTQIIKESLFDEILIFIAPKIIGKGINSVGNLGILNIDDAIEFTNTSYFKINEQMVFQGDRKCLQD